MAHSRCSIGGKCLVPRIRAYPPDLSSMPLWVDLHGVLNDLYSHKGLKCFTRAVGRFVKFHPSTERCICLDVARVLTEVNLHEPLVEKSCSRIRRELSERLG